ncbi:MAG: DUF2269 family protein [Hyphomicrobiales bacterium]
MTSYSILLFLHILAVILGLGATFAFPFIQAVGDRNGVVGARLAIRTIKRIEDSFVLPGAVLVFLFGLGLIFNDQTGYDDDMPAWLSIAVVWFIIAFVVAVLVQRRNENRALSILEGTSDGADLPAEYTAVSRQLQMVGGLLAISVIAIAFLMVWGREHGF